MMAVSTKAAELKKEVMSLLRHSWKIFLSVGIISVVLGCVAIILPFAASFAIEVMIGSILVVSGGLRFLHTIRLKKRFFALEAAASLVAIFIGGLMLWYPWEGIFALTFMLACFFMANGVFRIIWAVQLRDLPTWIWMLVSGIITLILGLIIWSGLPGDSHWVLGILLGIDLIVGGVALIIFSTTIRKIE